MNYGQNIDWKMIRKLIYETTKEVKLWIFQFKIVHRILATNLFLVNNKIKDIASCQHCNLEQTIRHLFWQCSETKHFWAAFQKFYLCKKNKIHVIILSCQYVLFGVLPPNRNVLLNPLLLIAKYYLYSIHFQNEKPSLIVFIEKVKGVIRSEETIAKKIGKIQHFNDKLNSILLL